MNEKRSKADELFFVVDEHDQPLDPLPRKLVHGHRVWHRVAHVALVNGRAEILCHQRSFAKELDPGKWVAVFGGHLAPGESYEQAAHRELQEEAGIAVDNLRLWRVHKFWDPTAYKNNEFQAVFVGRWNGKPTDVSFSDGEVEQVRWVPFAEVHQAMATKDPQWFTGTHQPLLIEELIHGVI